MDDLDFFFDNKEKDRDTEIKQKQYNAEKQGLQTVYKTSAE